MVPVMPDIPASVALNAAKPSSPELIGAYIEQHHYNRWES
jgi:hypothetical protein